MLSSLARSSSRLVLRSVVPRVAAAQAFRPLVCSLPSFHTVSARSFTASRSVRATRAEVSEAEAAEDANEDADEYDDEEGLDDFDYNENMDEYEGPAFVTKPAPYWEAKALVNGEFKDLSSSDFLGSWTVLFFYPLDFTFVCPTEIRAFSDRIAEFEKIDVKIVAASVDSEFSHLAWTKQPKSEGGLGPMSIPIIADITKKISKSYGVLLEEQGIALRGLFIIDPKGILRQSTINDLPIGRSVDETLRLLQAFQFNEQHGEVCPAGWKAGDAGMTTDDAGLKKYFTPKA